MSEIRDVIIIGSGPAGYTAAIYLGRAGLKPLVVAGALTPGGQLVNTTEVENFPGFPDGIMGPDLMENMQRQAERFNAEIVFDDVESTQLDETVKTVTCSGGDVYQARAVIIATGSYYRHLDVPGEEEYSGKGVSFCATCDGFFFRGRPVAVVGGGDTACEEALYLATLASKVYMIVRRDVLRASKYMQQRVADCPNIEVLYNTQTLGLTGSDVLEGAKLVRGKGTPEEHTLDIQVDGFFLAIGHKPNTDVFAPFIELDAQGYIKTAGASTATNIPGVFAAGDVADPTYRQAVTAAGTGCRAAIDVERFLLEN